MRTLLFTFLIVIPFFSLAGELEQAYEKEFAYLVAEKKALQQRLQELKTHQQQTIEKVSKEINTLQNNFLQKQNKTDRLNRQIAEASRTGDFVENDSLLLETTLSQASESLKKLQHSLAPSLKPENKLTQAFLLANQIIKADGQTNRTNGQYFLPNGEAVNGDILTVGRIAKYGLAAEGGGVLAPAGDGKFKVWDTKTQNIAQQLSENLYPTSLDIFLYDNAEKSIEKDNQKSFEDDVKAAGVVGEVIIALGGVGIILILIRIFLLKRAGSNINKTVSKVNQKIENNDIESALEICKSKTCAASNVIMATLRNLNKDRDHIEDVISESILQESSFIDRFGATILVIAAVSPLLGLLGTVTGMISTFDIITEYGTGDPKLLSSGISEALLTTKFGLVVAIPLLLVGTLLSSWGQKIKNELEQAALHIINQHKVA